jgi:tRNA dimethylallyltransferase
MRAVGYRQAWRYLDGAIDRAAFRDAAVAATRQLAKRQITWLRATAATRFDPFDAGVAATVRETVRRALGA